MEVLLANGAEVNAKNRFGATPLHRVAQKGHKDVVEVLCHHTRPREESLSRGAKDSVEDTNLPTGLKWRSGGCWSYGLEKSVLAEFEKIKAVILAFKEKNFSANQSEVEISVWAASREVQWEYQLFVTSSRYAPARHGVGTVAGKRQVISEYSPDEELMNEVHETLTPGCGSGRRLGRLPHMNSTSQGAQHTYDEVREDIGVPPHKH